MTIDLKNSDIFFDEIRKNVFGGNMSQGQVDGINKIFEGFEKYEFVEDQEERAYILATAYWESGHTMQPVEEGFYLGSKAKAFQQKLKYYPFYGRGIVQITWEYNYKKMGDLLGIDLVNHPELALDPDIAVHILIMGMERGLFAPAAGPLSKYLRTKEDWIDARSIVNGKDKENEIAAIAKKFDAAMEKAEGAVHIHVSDTPTPTPLPQPAETCEIDGDSIAEGINGYLKGCKGSHKVGESSSQILLANRVAGDSTYVVISAGTNDFGGYDPKSDTSGAKLEAIAAKLISNLEAMRARVKSGSKIIWIKPSGTREDVAYAGPIVQTFADKYKDAIVGYDKVAGDHVHPADYTALGKAVLAQMKNAPVPKPADPPKPVPVEPPPAPKPATVPAPSPIEHPATGATGGVVAGGLAAWKAGLPVGWIIAAAIAAGVIGALYLAYRHSKKTAAATPTKG